MNTAKIAKLCNEIEDVACDIARITMNDIVSAESRMIFNKAKEITAEIAAQPKSNADRIRQMSDEELARFLRNFDMCIVCQVECAKELPCNKGIMEWLKQEVQEND